MGTRDPKPPMRRRVARAMAGSRSVLPPSVTVALHATFAAVWLLVALVSQQTLLWLPAVGEMIVVVWHAARALRARRGARRRG